MIDIREMNSPKTIGYICLFKDSNTNTHSLYLQSKYLREKKGCDKVIYDIVKDRKTDSFEQRLNLKEIVTSMKGNDNLFILQPEKEELVKVHFIDEEELPKFKLKYKETVVITYLDNVRDLIKNLENKDEKF